MRLIAFVACIIVSIAARSQRYQPDNKTGVAAGISAGYSSKQCVIGNMSVGAMLAHHNHVSVNLTAFTKIRDAATPVVAEGRIGHVFTCIELYAGYGFHYASSDGEKYISDRVNGWKPAAGIVLKLPQTPWTISAAMSGNIFSLQLGLFGVR